MLSETKHLTLVLGLGNILLSDDAVGVRVAERLLEEYSFPPDVLVLDGGTLGLDLLAYVQDADRLVVVDALNVKAKPGTVARLADEEVPAFLAPKISPHQMGLVDLLAASRLSGHFPGELVLWGVQPESLEVGLEMSPTVAAQVDGLVQHVLDELSRWGITPTRIAKEEEPTW
jgi:hydrogenase maturation protease